MSEISERTLLTEKPNVFLYALEATRLPFLSLFALVLILGLMFRIRTDQLPVEVMVRIVLVLYGGGCFLFFWYVALLARNIELLVTDKRVAVRLTIFGYSRDKISIPLSLIEGIETRTYNGHYGSVYFTRFDPTTDFPPRSSAKLTTRTDCASFWLSMPLSSPPLTGFYGFKNFEAFANLVSQAQRRLWGRA